MTNILVCWCKSSVAENLRSPTILCSKHKHLNFVRSLQTMGVVFYLGEKAVFRKTSDTNVTLLFLSYNFGNNVVSTWILEKGWIGNSFVIYILSSVEHTGNKHCPTCMVIMLMNSISFMRIITIASCAMFVSGLFKITEPKIVNSIE